MNRGVGTILATSLLLAACEASEPVRPTGVTSSIERPIADHYEQTRAERLVAYKQLLDGARSLAETTGNAEALELVEFAEQHGMAAEYYGRLVNQEVTKPINHRDRADSGIFIVPLLSQDSTMQGSIYVDNLLNPTDGGAAGVYADDVRTLFISTPDLFSERVRLIYFLHELRHAKDHFDAHFKSDPDLHSCAVSEYAAFRLQNDLVAALIGPAYESWLEDASSYVEVNYDPLQAKTTINVVAPLPPPPGPLLRQPLSESELALNQQSGLYALTIRSAQKAYPDNFDAVMTAYFEKDYCAPNEGIGKDG